jgi:AcrR family transcriptional regulator
VGLPGRKAQAARNDELILVSARTVFTADPDAPIAAVARHAGVGISALYRRYRSKEELLQRLARDSLLRYIALVEAALADSGEPWSVFCGFMQRCVASGLTIGDSTTAHERTRSLLARTRAAGLRPEIDVADIALLLDMLRALHVGDEQRSAELRQRYLALLLDALHFLSLSALPGAAPGLQEIGTTRSR